MHPRIPLVAGRVVPATLSRAVLCAGHECKCNSSGERKPAAVDCASCYVCSHDPGTGGWTDIAVLTCRSRITSIGLGGRRRAWRRAWNMCVPDAIDEPLFLASHHHRSSSTQPRGRSVCINSPIVCSRRWQIPLLFAFPTFGVARLPLFYWPNLKSVYIYTGWAKNRTVF